MPGEAVSQGVVTTPRTEYRTGDWPSQYQQHREQQDVGPFVSGHTNTLLPAWLRRRRGVNTLADSTLHPPWHLKGSVHLKG